MRIVSLCLLSSLFVNTLLAEIEVPKIIVSSSATIYRPADYLTLTIGVVTSNTSVQTALNENNKRMQDVLTALKSTGISDQEFQTGSFSITPQYSPMPKNPPPDWQSTIVGYQVKNTIAIHTSNLGLAGPVVDAVGKVGANLIEDISFTIKNNTDAQSEAIAEAVGKAQAYAEAAAKKAGINLGNILELSTSNSTVTPMYKAERHYAMAASPTPISSGNIEVNANVNITYSIGQSPR